MPVQVDCVHRRINTRKQIPALNCNGHTLLVWWYSGVYKNKRDQTQPLVLVIFRKRLGKNIFSDEIVCRYISIALLGQLPIGSLCRGNRVVAHPEYKARDYDVLFERGHWWFTSFEKTSRRNQPPPFPREIYPLPYERDKNWLVELRLGPEGTLLIPCLEFFNRCYGQSGELRRILMTYPWNGPDGCLERFFAPLGEPEDPTGKIWKIKLRRRLHNDDSVFLAHVKYDHYTREVAKSIHSGVETQYSGDSNTPAFPRIGPWYRGRATLRVGGIPYNNGNSFLGLEVLGATEPLGSEISRNRDNRGNALNPADPEAEGNAWAGAPVRRPNQGPEIVNLSVFDEPDNGGDSIELCDPEFTILGPRRIVHTHRDEQAEDKGGSPRPGSDSDTFSAGEGHGSGKDIGHASVKTEIVLESDGALRDMWNAMQHLRKLYPQSVRSVEWYSPSSGFTQSDDPALVALSPFKKGETIDGEPIPTSTRNWPYMDATIRRELRGLLVARINIRGAYVYIIEIQRRPCVRKDSEGKVFYTEESFKGFVFRLKNEERFGEWFNFVQSQIRRVKGVVHKLTKDCPGLADSFRHVSSTTDEVACWSALKNALNKVDIDLEVNQK